jgi:hypothetical protein
VWLGCAGSDSSSSSSSTSAPTPTLTSISPSNAQPGGSDFTITATGTDFIPPGGGECGSEICFNHSLRETSFISSTQLTATIPAGLIAEAGTVPVFIVTNCEVASNTLTFNIGSCSPVVTERISVTSAGAQANGISEGPAMSSDGRYIAFSSEAPDVVTGDGNGFEDIFLRDSCRGATGCTPSTIRISVDTGGGDPNGASADPYISDDGRFVVFDSEASDLVAADGNAFIDIFLRDTCIGATGSCTPSTTRVSVDTGGGDGDGDCGDAVVSSTGRFVSFQSDASDLVAGDGNFTRDAFVRDTCIGATSCTPSTIRVSVSTGGTEGNSFSDEPYISGSGRFVAYQSDADNLVTGDGNFTNDVFVRDTCIGATSCTPSTIRASVNTANVEGNGFSEEPQVSDDGRFVVFGSFASNLVTGDTDFLSDIFVRDTCVGATSCTPATFAVSVSSGGTLGNLTSFSPKINASGRFVTFDSEADNLVSGDLNGEFDIFVRDTCAGVTGCTPSTIRVSVNSSGVEGDGFSNDPFITDSGQLVAFNSESTNLVAGDTNGTADVFLSPTCF